MRNRVPEAFISLEQLPAKVGSSLILYTLEHNEEVTPKQALCSLIEGCPVFWEIRQDTPQNNPE